MTDHSTDIVFQGATYRADIPFKVGTIDSGSNFAADNTELTITCDETVFKIADFRSKLFNNAKTKIFWLDTVSPSDGSLIGRQGWFGPIAYDENGDVSITVLGLMKILDFEVVRVYQAACDADFGDKRCRMAVDLSPSRAARNFYTVGDWVHVHDTSVMTSAGLQNGGFEADASVTISGDPIDSWTAVGTTAFKTQSVITGLSPTEGSYALTTGDDGGAADNNFTSTMYQDIAISSWGTTEIDAGELVFALFYDVGAWTNNQSGIKVKIEMMGTNGEVLYFKDPGWQFFDAAGVWHGQSIVTPIIAGTRTIRVWVQMVKVEDSIARVAIDNMTAFYYDATSVDPHNSVIHKMEQVNTPGGGDAVNTPTTEYLRNGSFEEGSPVGPSNSLGLSGVPGWSIAGWGQVKSAVHGLTPQHGDQFFAHADSGGGSQHETTLRAYKDFATDWENVDLTQVDDGTALFTFFYRLGFGDTGLSSMSLSLWWLTAENYFIGSEIDLATDVTGVAGVWLYQSHAVSPPPNARAFFLTFTLKSHTDGVGTASLDKIGCDVRPQNIIGRGADVTAQGEDGTVFSTTAGEITQDGDILWKAHTQRFAYDTVDTVTDKKTFVAATLSGTSKTYQFGKILWLSGDNAGQESIVRIFDADNGAVKTYFPVANTIQSGDRFMITEGCSKDFTNDCFIRFNNVINFRGFPYAPGRIIEEDGTENEPEFPNSTVEYFVNSSFDDGAAGGPGLGVSIPGWSIGGRSEITASKHGLTPEDGSLFFTHADYGIAGEFSSLLAQNIDFATEWDSVNVARIDEGASVFTFLYSLGFGDDGLSSMTVTLYWYTENGEFIQRHNLARQLRGESGVWTEYSHDVTPPVGARQLSIWFYPTTHTDGVGTASLDNVRCRVTP
jgi:hypothetical protein